MEPKRGHWYLLTALILGLTLGLVYSWVISPLTQEDTHPSALREDYQDVYRSLISRAYQANRNLPRARARLELLGEEEPALALAAQAQRSLAVRDDQEMARILADLSSALREPPNSSPATDPKNTPVTSTAAESETGDTLTPTSPPEGTEAVPTRDPQTEIPPSPTSTKAPPFTLQDSSPLCDPELEEPLLQVYATDASGEGVPGVELIISWAPDNRETFFTGLKPDLGSGYADFELDPGVVYTVEVPDNRTLVTDLETQRCSNNGGEPYWGSWEIYITHPN